MESEIAVSTNCQRPRITIGREEGGEDEILTYLLMSASSSAAIRVDDWESNWGKDKLPDMARASVTLSFFAFIALASSSLISGYTLCTLKSM
ncbi:hypothetical protein ACFX2I_044970 [Malus domestica]